MSIPEGSYSAPVPVETRAVTSQVDVIVSATFNPPVAGRIEFFPAEVQFCPGQEDLIEHAISIGVPLVTLGPGDYSFSGTLSGRSNQMIVGSGMGATVLRQNRENAPLIEWYNKVRYGIRDCMIIGNQHRQAQHNGEYPLFKDDDGERLYKRTDGVICRLDGMERGPLTSSKYHDGQVVQSRFSVAGSPVYPVLIDDSHMLHVIMNWKDSLESPSHPSTLDCPQFENLFITGWGNDGKQVAAIYLDNQNYIMTNSQGVEVEQGSDIYHPYIRNVIIDGGRPDRNQIGIQVGTMDGTPRSAQVIACNIHGGAVRNVHTGIRLSCCSGTTIVGTSFESISGDGTNGAAIHGDNWSGDTMVFGSRFENTDIRQSLLFGSGGYTPTFNNIVWSTTVMSTTDNQNDNRVYPNLVSPPPVKDYRHDV